MKLTISENFNKIPVMTITGEKDYQEIVSLLEKTLQKCSEEGIGWARTGEDEIDYEQVAMGMLGLVAIRTTVDEETGKLVDGVGSYLMRGLGHHSREVGVQALKTKRRFEKGDKI